MAYLGVRTPLGDPRVAFTSKDQILNKAHVQYLETRLIAIANDAKRCELDNANTVRLCHP